MWATVARADWRDFSGRRSTQPSTTLSPLHSSLSSPRRAALAALAATLLAARPASAAIGVWDGKSSALGSCAVGDAGDECRRATLARDAGRGEGYSSQIKGSATLQSNSAGLPIADLSGPYATETVALAGSIRSYLALAPADPTRIPAGKALKAAGAAWAAKYARGGSARAPSARRMYIAADAIQGHLAANGAAPFPASKADKLIASLDEVEGLLKAGR